MNAPRQTAANRQKRPLERRGETVVSMVVAVIGPLVTHEEKIEISSTHSTDIETEYNKSSHRRSRHDRRSSRIRCRDSRGSSHELFTVIQPDNAYLGTAMGYHSYRMADRSQYYDDGVARHIAKMGRRLKVQLKSQMFDGSDPITILSFLPAFQMTSDKNRVHEGADMWLFHFFRKKPAGAEFNAKKCLTSSRRSCQKGNLTSYC